MKLRDTVMALAFAGVVGCADKKEEPAPAPLKGPPTTEECAAFMAHNQKIMSDLPFSDDMKVRFMETCPTTYSRAEIACAMNARDLAGINACDPKNKK